MAFEERTQNDSSAWVCGRRRSFIPTGRQQKSPFMKLTTMVQLGPTFFKRQSQPLIGLFGLYTQLRAACDLRHAPILLKPPGEESGACLGKMALLCHVYQPTSTPCPRSPLVPLRML